MGIKRVRKEKFGNAVMEIRQVFDGQPTETTVEVGLNILGEIFWCVHF